MITITYLLVTLALYLGCNSLGLVAALTATASFYSLSEKTTDREILVPLGVLVVTLIVTGNPLVAMTATTVASIR